MGKLSLDQLLHTIDIVHEYSCDSNSISFEEQTLNLQIESSQPVEKSNNEENLQDDLDSTSTKTPSTKATNFVVCRFEVPANAVTRKRSRRICCKTKMNRNKSSGTIKIKSINENLQTINMEGMKIESLQKEQFNKRGRGRPPKETKTENMVDEEVVTESYTSRKSARKQSRPMKVRRIMNDKTSPKGYREGNSEFLAVANEGSCINLADDDDKLNEKKSALETETPEPLKVVLNSNCTTAQVGNKLQLNKENPKKNSVRTADDCHLNVEGQVVENLDSASMKWPFVKSSPLWKTIKSSELFSSMPQQPHFLPLKHYSKSRREGMAIGLMVTYSTIVNNVLNFSISDPDEMIDTLNDLERHGFKLYNMRGLLEYFRALNEEKKRIMNELHVTNNLKSDGQSNKDLLNEKLEATDKTIMELEQPMIKLKHMKKSLDKEKSVKLTEAAGSDCGFNKLQNDGRTIENSYPAAESSLRSSRGKLNIDLNEAIENLNLDDPISTDDKEEESKEERVNENKLSICEKGSNKIERALTFEQVSKYFYMPITQASKELNMGLTALKKKCRELGIPRWPHRKMKSLETLIRNVQEIGREEGVVGEEELDIEKLEQEKKLMEKEPAIMMEEKTKKLRQAFFKANYKKRRLQSQFVPEVAAADQSNIQHIN